MEEDLKLVTWLAEKYHTNIRFKNGKAVYLWCLQDDAEHAWDGYDDDRIKWYTSEQILEIYKKQNKL